jgi:predicted CDP-diglyceride synthetase/phosphatidate cytidylyltransferase
MGALFLTILGLLIVGGMVYFNVERERIMRRYAGITTRLRAWD